MPWIIVSAGFVLGLGFVTVGRLRARLTRLEEAVGDCAIGELEPERRYRLRGRVVPIDTSQSLVDGVDCVYIERAEYRTVGSGALLQEVTHTALCHPFYLEDDSGRLLVDPGRTLIECATAKADGGLTVERRLRSGEEVSLTASFRHTDEERHDGEGPYRSPSRQWEAAPDSSGPPRLSHRTLDAMVARPMDGVTAFLGGAGAMMLMMSTLLAFVLAFMVR